MLLLLLLLLLPDLGAVSLSSFLEFLELFLGCWTSSTESSGSGCSAIDASASWTCEVSAAFAPRVVDRLLERDDLEEDVDCDWAGWEVEASEAIMPERVERVSGPCATDEDAMTPVTDALLSSGCCSLALLREDLPRDMGKVS